MKRIEILKNELAQRVLILDGAMGTMIQQFKLVEKDFRGKPFALHSHNLKGCNDVLNLTKPEIIREIHLQYLQAGADIIETNTFNGTSISMADYALEPEVRNINMVGAKLACEARDAYFAETGKFCFVAGAVGPTNKTASLIANQRSTQWKNVFEAFSEQIGALIDGGVDIINIESVLSSAGAKAALSAAKNEMEKRKISVPVVVSATITKNTGTLISGQSLKELILSVSEFPLLSFGINCSFGAQNMDSSVENLCEISQWPVCLYPSAGLPLENGEYPEAAEVFAQAVIKWTKNNNIRIIGGCCGTTPDYIQMIVKGL